MIEKVYQALLKVLFPIIRSKSFLALPPTPLPTARTHLLKRFNLVRLAKKVNFAFFFPEVKNYFYLTMALHVTALILQ